MLLLEVVKIPVGISLGVVAAILAVSIVASLLRTSANKPTHPIPPEALSAADD